MCLHACAQRVVKTQAKAGEWYGPDRPKWLGATRSSVDSQMPARL